MIQAKMHHFWEFYRVAGSRDQNWTCGASSYLWGMKPRRNAKALRHNKWKRANNKEKREKRRKWEIRGFLKIENVCHLLWGRKHFFLNRLRFFCSTKNVVNSLCLKYLFAKYLAHPMSESNEHRLKTKHLIFMQDPIKECPFMFLNRILVVSTAGALVGN